MKQLESLKQDLAVAIDEHNNSLRCETCGHKRVFHQVSETGKRKVRCLGNREKCRCQIAPQFTSLHP